MRGRWCSHIPPDIETRQREENKFSMLRMRLYIEVEDANREVKGYVRSLF